MNYNLPLDVKNELIGFFEQFNFIDKVVVFGSRARKDNNTKSDIDLCVYSVNMTNIEFNTLKYEIDELPILYKIDIVHFEKVDNKLKTNILNDAKLFYERV